VAAHDPGWHYRKGTSEASSPSSAWRLPDFIEDETWLTGQASIGFGDIDDRTILGDMYGNYVSVFLRHAFTVAPGQVPGALRLRLRVDDGCIVWINGLEATLMNPGTFSFYRECRARSRGQPHGFKNSHKRARISSRKHQRPRLPGFNLNSRTQT
jgi:hypothetical protein